MIHSFIVKAKDLLRPARDEVPSLIKIKAELHLLKKLQFSTRQLDEKQAIARQRHIQALDELLVAYLCHDFINLFSAEAPSEDMGNIHLLDTHHWVLQDLKSPTYRAMNYKHLPHTMLRLIKLSRDTNDSHSLCQKFALSMTTQQEVTIMANQAPFTHNQLLADFNAVKELPFHLFCAIICATLLHQHCLKQDAPELEKTLFNHGLRNGFISLLRIQNATAQSHRQPEPIKVFIASILPFISLIYITRELRNTCANCHHLPLQAQLLHEITDMLPKLTYWIAKDWGLSDDLLVSLKDCFIPTSDTLPIKQHVRISNHANLAIMLYQTHLFSHKQVVDLLDSMGIKSQVLLAQMCPTTH